MNGECECECECEWDLVCLHLGLGGFQALRPFFFFGIVDFAA